MMLVASAALVAAWVVSPVPTAPLACRRSAPPPLMAADQRVAIVTGASRGIGKVSLLLAQRAAAPKRPS